jgi:hypothetical protein
MGEVYRAKDTKLGREVAIKVLARCPDLWLHNPGRRRYRRQALAFSACPVSS